MVPASSVTLRTVCGSLTSPESTTEVPVLVTVTPDPGNSSSIWRCSDAMSALTSTVYMIGIMLRPHRMRLVEPI